MRYSTLLQVYPEKYEAVTDNPSIIIYVNKIENRITFKIKIGYYLEPLTPEAMKLLESTKCKINKDKNGETVPHLDMTELVLVHCNIVNNDYEQDSRVLFTTFTNKSFRSLLYISPNNFRFLKTLNSEFSYIEVGSTDRNSKPLKIEDKINIKKLLIK